MAGDGRFRVADSKQAFRGDGMATAQSWLRGHCRLSGRAASQAVHNGRVMQQLPDFAAGHRHDELARVVQTFCDRLDADGPEPDPTGQRRLSIAQRADGRWHTYRPDGTEILVIRPAPVGDPALARAG